VVCGVCLAPLVAVSLWVGAFGALAMLYALRLGRLFALVVGCVGGLVFGLGYGTAHIGDRQVFDLFAEQQVYLSGTVREDPTLTLSGQLSVQLNELAYEDRKLPGALLVTVGSATPVKRGDVLFIDGVFSEGFGSYVGSMKRAKVEKVVHPEPGDVGRRVRDWFAELVRDEVPDPQASLGIGFLTGQKSALPNDLSESLRIVGLTHIVVASGYNLTILVRISRRLFIRVSKYLSALSSGTMIVVFMAVTGLSPSMVRAGLVSGLSLLTWYYGHSFHPLVLLPFAAMITVMAQPSYAWGDLGWQLSFAAFAGVMIVAPLLQRYFFGDKEPGIIRQILGETVAAHIVTIPLIALSFGTVSNVAIFANLLVVPFVPIAMLVTFLVGAWSLTQLPFVELLAVPTEWLLAYMTNVATFLSELSWAQHDIAIEPWWWLVYVAAVALACSWMQRATGYSFRQSNPVV